MRFTINGFSQIELVKRNLDAIDSLLLRYFIDFKDTGKMIKKNIEDDTYYWLEYDYLIKELPVLNLNKPDSIYRRFKKMCQCNILKSKTIRAGGVYSYYTVGSEYICLIDTDAAEKNNSDINPKLTDINPDISDINPNISDEKPELIDSSININLLYKSNNIYSSIIEYLNKKANTSYRSTSKKTQSLIKARLAEGFKIEEFIKVIENKSNEWLNTDFEKYLRPETLFGPKFESYLNQQPKEGKHGGNKSNSNETKSLQESGIGL